MRARIAITTLLVAPACSTHQENQAIQEVAESVRTRLFAPGVPSDSLALSICIETLGGVSTVLIPRGTPLPAEKREIFSTAADNQSSVEVHILQGERPLAQDNRSLGRFHLDGIPPAARGIPQIEVVFAVDASGMLEVSATDLATDKSQKVTITGSSGAALTKADIDEMLRNAEKDPTREEWSTARNDLDALIYSTQKLLTENGAKLPDVLRRRCETELESAKKVLATHSQCFGDQCAPAPLKAAHASLQSAAHAASAALYKRR